MKTQITIELDAEEIADGMDRDECIQFIKELDEQMQDWDFTLELCEHFEKLKKEWQKEQGEELSRFMNADLTQGSK